MTLPGQRFTYEEYKRLPGDERYELVEGELVMTPAPTSRHQRILIRLTSILEAFTYGQGLGTLLIAPTDLVLSKLTVLQPDLLLVMRDREAIIDPDGAVHGAPDLVIEILSPSNAQRDLDEKRLLYSKFGVGEYWIVDPGPNCVLILTQQGAGLETWQRFAANATLSSPLLPGLQIELTDIFPV